jgi:hypothetical protein
MRKLLAALKESRELGFRATISQARLLPIKHSHAVMLVVSGGPCFEISQAVVRAWLMWRHYASRASLLAAAVWEVLSPAQLAALTAACSKDALDAALAAPKTSGGDAVDPRGARFIGHGARKWRPTA